MGYNHKTGDSLVAKVFQFSEQLISARMIDELALARVRQKDEYGKYKTGGRVFAFDTNTGQINWSRHFFIPEDPYINQGVLITADANGPLTRNPSNYKKKWKFYRNTIFRGNGYTNKERVIGLGYKSISKVKRLEGLDFTSGEVIWERTIERDFIIETKQINDSTILINSNGLHTVDLETGKGWDFDIEIGTRKMPAFRMIGNILVSLQGNYFFYQGHDIENGSISNSTIHEDKVYYIGDHRLYCLDLLNGAKIWETDLPQKESDFYLLSKSETTLTSIGVKEIEENIKFEYHVAANSLNDGKMLFDSSFVSTAISTSIVTNQQSTFLLSDSTSITIPLMGNQRKEFFFLKENLSKPKTYLSSYLPQYKGSEFIIPEKKSSENILVKLVNNDIIELDKNLNLVNKVTFDQSITANFSNEENLTPYNLENTTLIFDRDNKLQFTLNERDFEVQSESLFYCVRGSKLYVVKI